MFYNKQSNFKKNFFFIVVRTRTFYVYVIDKRLAARFYNVFSKNSENYLNELCYRIDCALRKSSHSKQIQKSHKRSQISRLLDQNHFIAFEKKSIKKATHLFASSFKNSSTLSGKLTSRMMTSFIFIAMFIIRYLFLIFLLIRNQKLR